MRPRLCRSPVTLSEQVETAVKRIRRAKLFVFLRQVRHLLFGEEFQVELASLYLDSPIGQPPVRARLTLHRASGTTRDCPRRRRKPLGMRTGHFPVTASKAASRSSSR
jgi:hypothetical protein